jgi:formylglycine-generating enzyme required for sulfatase activity
VPTAAELEYVARLGNSAPCFPLKYFPQRTNVGDQKNPGPVKSKAPNAWGVYDLPCSAITAVSDWKAPNRPGKVTDPQGEPFDSPWVYYDNAIQSAQKPDGSRPILNMILKPPHNYPAVHKGASGLDWDRPNQHDRYGEDGLDGGNGRSWIGVFRVVVESPD